MQLIDTHCHIDVTAFDQDRPAVLERCGKLGINIIIVPGIQRQTWDQLLQTCVSYPGLNPALGLHPMFMQQHTPAHLEDLNTYIEKHRPVAIGEIGLDFYQPDSDIKQQQYYFEGQIDIACAHHLPIILHARKSHEAILNKLKSSPQTTGIVHAFSGSIQQAEQYIDLGFKLGFGGMLTYERSRKLRQLAKQLPLESIVLETDAPDMTVARHRGERNSPEYIIDCLTTLAEIRQQSVNEIANQTTLNAKSIFKLNEQFIQSENDG